MLKSLLIIENKLLALKYKDYGNLNFIDISTKELEIIKQDLEILEIIYNKHVSVGRIKFYIPVAHDDYSLLKKYNDFVHAKSDELTLVELKKIKQWLLSKKVGDSHD